MSPRKIVLVRDGACCRRCGRYLREYSVHHRLPRGMGGSRSSSGHDRTERPSNLVVLCGSGVTGCHGWIESNRSKAYESGWLVHRWDDPQEVALIDTFGRTFYLTDAGELRS